MRLILPVLAAAFAFASAPALAKAVPSDPTPSNPVSPPTPTAACPDTELAPTPADARAKLNQQQADFARCQLEQNAANQKAHDDAVKANEELVRRQQADYEAAMAKWKADVEACKAGDTSKCAQK